MIRNAYELQFGENVKALCCCSQSDKTAAAAAAADQPAHLCLSKDLLSLAQCMLIASLTSLLCARLCETHPIHPPTPIPTPLSKTAPDWWTANMQPWQPAVCRILCGGRALQVITPHTRRHRGIFLAQLETGKRKRKLKSNTVAFIFL